jgi:hypothetical protein
MRLTAGSTYKTSSGETFGPVRESEGKFSLKFCAVKLGQTFTFHESGRYHNDPRQAHYLDLVAVA